MSLKERVFWAAVIFTPLCVLLSQYASKVQVTQAQPAGAELALTASDFKFQPNSASVKAASPIKVTVTNKGAVAHTWVLLDKDGKESQKIEIGVGQTASKHFTSPIRSSATCLDIKKRA